VLVEGTIQRIDYRKGELRVVSQGQVWRFLLAADCRLWFNHTPAVLRCFHPLDRVQVLFCSDGTDYVANALYSWEP
jgi:hypothetical protein